MKEEIILKNSVKLWIKIYEYYIKSGVNNIYATQRANEAKESFERNYKNNV